MIPRHTCLFFCVAYLTTAFLATAFLATAAIAQGRTSDEYLLRYKLKPGNVLVSKVEHFAETKTTMTDHVEQSSSRTASEKAWEVQSVTPEGEATFVYKILAVNLAQTVGENNEISYNSSTDQEIPDVFKPVASTIGKPLATITINSRGQVIKREGELKNHQMGMGDLTVPLPEGKIKIGGQWSVPRELRVKLDNGKYKKVKVRELYTLEKVSAGLATIKIETQPTTPVSSRAVEAQLMQQLSKGKIKFDIDAGVMLSKKLDWSDRVIAFRGPDSSLEYDAKFTEELVENKRTASLPRQDR